MTNYHKLDGLIHRSCCLTVLKAKSMRSGSQKGHSISEGSRERFCLASFFLASGSCQLSVAFLGL